MRRADGGGRAGAGTSGARLAGAGAGAELRALRSARRRLTLQFAAAIAVVMAALGAFAYHLEADRQRTEVQQALAFAIQGSAPQETGTCEWLFVLRDGTIEAPRQSPAGFPLRRPLLALSAPTGASAAQTTLAANGTVYAVLTERRGAEVLQSVFDTRYQRADLRDTAMALISAELVGIAVSFGIGFVLAHRSLMPMGRALAKQRRFIADASHELRTPLTRLHTRTQLLLRRQRGRLPADVVAELDLLVHGTRELGEVVEDLLLSASLRPGGARSARVDLAALAAAVAEAEQPRAVERSLTVALDRPPDPVEVDGLESPLRRMISALVDNAIGHTGAGGRIELAVRPAGRGRFVEVSVSDDGCGFDQADRARIFDRFARGSGGQGRRFGLGLALVREIVQNHGGTVSAAGRPGQGARFTVRLPAAPDAVCPGRAVETAEPTAEHVPAATASTAVPAVTTPEDVDGAAVDGQVGSAR